jgi:hypothetical protein
MTLAESRTGQVQALSIVARRPAGAASSVTLWSSRFRPGADAVQRSRSLRAQEPHRLAGHGKTDPNGELDSRIGVYTGEGCCCAAAGL